MDDMKTSYSIPSGASIGHVHLKVTDLARALQFYIDLLGFELTTMYGSQAAFISAGGYHHHIGLNTWHSLGGQPAPRNSAGLYHTAILYPSRKDLAEILQRLMNAGYPITGAADHGVSEAIYLDDPDGNGVELYCDRPKTEWKYSDEGQIEMTTLPMDLDDLLLELDAENSSD